VALALAGAGVLGTIHGIDNQVQVAASAASNYGIPRYQERSHTALKALQEAATAFVDPE
jgi:hypothetical protein